MRTRAIMLLLACAVTLMWFAPSAAVAQSDKFLAAQPWTKDGVKNATIPLFQIEEVRSKIGITEEQMSKIAALNREYQQVYASLYEGLTDLTGPALVARTQKINRESERLQMQTLSGIFATLTAEQKVQIHSIANDIASGRSGVVRFVGKGKIVPVFFDSKELARANANTVLAKLNETAGKLANCPAPRTKLAEGVYLCGDGTIVETNNNRLQSFIGAGLR